MTPERHRRSLAPMLFEATRVDDARATEVLEAYFAERAAGFPGGGYKVNLPDPSLFVAPAGVFVLVTDDDGAPLGCGGVKRLSPDFDGRERFEIKHLYLRPAARGTGAGRRLLAELETRAVELGASVAVLDTNASLTAAGSLYRSNGYVETAPYNDNPNATHWFSKKLAP